MYGADVLTLINKAIDVNEKNNIEKNVNGLYVENDENSVVVMITLLSTNDKGEIIEKNTQMEVMESGGLDRFISNFGLTTFQCTNIEYNSRKLVKRIYLKQIEL